MTDEDIDKIKELLVFLESRAKDFEAPLPKMNKEGDKETFEWHCQSRAAGIRDAAHCLRLKFNL